MYRLMIADDSEVLLERVKESILDGLSDKVTIDTVCNGREACDYVQKTPPDLVLMDISMPEMNGLEAAKEMRLGNYDGPIILWSLSSSTVRMAQSRKNYATLILDKAKHATEIGTIVQKYL